MAKADDKDLQVFQELQEKLGMHLSFAQMVGCCSCCCFRWAAAAHEPSSAAAASVL